MRFGSRLSIERFKNTVIKTKLLVPVFAGQAETTRAHLWCFFLNPQFSFGEKGMCLFILFISWLPDPCSYLYIWFLSALSVYLSSPGMNQRLQMFRVFFPIIPTPLCMCLSSVSVFTQTFVSAEGKVMSTYLLGSAPEQSCRASSEQKFTVSVARLTWDFGWRAGWKLHFHIRAPHLLMLRLLSSSSQFSAFKPAEQGRFPRVTLRCSLEGWPWQGEAQVGASKLTQPQGVEAHRGLAFHRGLLPWAPATPARLCCICTRASTATGNTSI